MNITQLVFLRPRETPPSYKDEGHSLEIGLIPLQLGDVRRWDEQTWQVTHVETYAASTGTSNTFHLAVLTPDGTLANPLSLCIGDQRLLHLYFSSEDFALTWPEPDECLPHVGNEAPPLEGWQVERRQEWRSRRWPLRSRAGLLVRSYPGSSRFHSGLIKTHLRIQSFQLVIRAVLDTGLGWS